MNTLSKKTAFGITTVAAATALIAGFAAPAMASAGHATSLTDGSTHSASSTRSESATKSQSTKTQGQLDALRTVTSGISTGSATSGISTGSASNSSPVVVSPSVSAPTSIGDVASGNTVASGDQAPLLSANEGTVGNNVGNGESAGGIDTTLQNLLNASTPTSSAGTLDSLLGGR